MTFEWDEEKNRLNKLKHHISFELATSVFDDPRYIEYRDVEHSDEENRYIAIGCVLGRVMVLSVAYAERGKALRLISARKATKAEKEAYYGEDR